MKNEINAEWLVETCSLCSGMALCRNKICHSCDRMINGDEVYEAHLNELIEMYSPEMDERCGNCGGNLDHNYRCRNLNCNQHYIR